MSVATTFAPPDVALVPGAHPWVDAFLRLRLPDGEQVDRAIHPADEMLEFAIAEAAGDLDAGLTAYFASGLEIAETIERIAAARFGGLGRVGRMLDFGCGYGRITRFLLRCLPAERLWVCDILGDAVEFQQRHFGVHGFGSASRPEDLAPPPGAPPFDLIYVGSLFTHLPPQRFSPWFDRLAGMLSPEGLLVMSVHDRELLPPELAMPPAGICFRPHSESRTIDHAEYGSTWVTEEYVQRVIETPRATSQRAWRWRRVPRGLCAYQDLYLVSPADAPDPASLVLDPGPQGQIETCEALRPGELRLTGWAIGRGSGVERVTVWVGGERLGDYRDLQPRPDIAASFGDERFSTSGFGLDIRLPVPVRRADAIVVVEAVSATGVRRALYCGGLERLLYLTARENYLRHRQRVFELAEIIERMKHSRFWRLRRAWFRLKRALGLSSENPDGPVVSPTDRRPAER
ncbi:MAG TPA: class I SAM-dependent methyltransferase [Thermoanaerobaculia bacterium]|nr:class I SAM-dependent methyltransferase [Thermoanaerobaculia bacterium]